MYVQLEEVVCASCGTAFGLSTTFAAQRRTNRQEFYCPNGHGQWFPGETETARANRLAKQIETERTLRYAAEQRERQAEIGRKREVTRRRNLQAAIAAGRCPKCRRNFANVRRHMEGKHPELCHDEE